jgi:TolA-binding protein
MKHTFLRIVSALTSALLLIGAPSARLSARQQDREDMCRRYLQQGLDFLKAGSYDQAVQEFNRIIEGSPTSSKPEALYRLAEYYFDAGELDKADPHVAALIDPKGQSSDFAAFGFILSGRIKLVRADTAASVEDALGDFRRVPSYFPGRPAVPSARYFEAETQRVMGQAEAAVDVFRQVATAYPRSIWAARALLGEARCLVALGQATSALEPLQRVRDRFPTTPEAVTAHSWNTIIYRLYLRADPPYRFANRVIAGTGGKLKDVDVLAVGPDGTLYAAGQDRVASFDPSSGATRPGLSGTGVRGITTDPSGRVVLVQKAALMPVGAKPLAFSIGAGATAKPLEDITSAVVSWRKHEILIAEAKQKIIARFSPKAEYLGNVANADINRLAIDSQDTIAALSTGNHTISVFTTDGRNVDQVGRGGRALEEPRDLAFDGLGHLYVLDRRLAAVVIFAPSNRATPLTQFTIAQKNPGAFRKGQALALDPAGRLYIYDADTERIQVYQ